MEKHVLAKPISYDGETIIEINMDLDDLSVADLEKAERIARSLLKKKEAVGIIELNKRYQICLAHMASGVPLEAFRLMSAKDYTQIGLLVQNFLLDGDSEEEDEDEKDSKTPSGKTPNSPKPPTASKAPENPLQS